MSQTGPEERGHRAAPLPTGPDAPESGAAEDSGPPTDAYRRGPYLPPGTVLNRAYATRSVVGQGGFGVVYEATHLQLEHPVAIKEYFPEEFCVRVGDAVHAKSTVAKACFDDGMKRFREEAKRLIELRGSPNVVAYREFFLENGTAYIVMDFEDGMPLSELLARREAAGRGFEERDLVAVMVPVLRGLQRLHQAGIFHRDVKPGNILIRRRTEQAEEVPVLIDFGAAKQAFAEHSRTNAPHTPGYAALEQVGEGDLGPWTDVYAAGAVMWRMVACGSSASGSDGPVRVESRVMARLRGRPDPMPRAVELGRGRFSPRLLELIEQCLELRESDRVKDCTKVLQVLQSIHRNRGPDSGLIDLNIRNDWTAKSAVYNMDMDTKSSGIWRSKIMALALVFAVIGCVESAVIIKNSWHDSTRTEAADSTPSTVGSGNKATDLPTSLPAKSQGKSSSAPSIPSFRVEVEPSDAAVFFSNEAQPYTAGIPLALGTYELDFRAVGHQPLSTSIQHDGSGTVPRVALQSLEVPPLTPRARSPFKPTVQPRPAEAAQRPKPGQDPEQSRPASTDILGTGPSNASTAPNTQAIHAGPSPSALPPEVDPAPAAHVVPPTVAEPDLGELAKDAWQEARDSDSPEVLGAFIDTFDGRRGASLWVTLAKDRLAKLPASPVAPTNAPVPPKQPIRIGGNIARARLTHQIRPRYPPHARQARVEGTVKLSAIIARDGTVQSPQATSGHPLLIPAALAAVKQWRYRPTLLNGVPVEVLTSIELNFTLGDRPDTTTPDKRQSPSPRPAPRLDQPKRDFTKPQLAVQVKPSYPMTARRARVEGTVRLRVTIAKDGTIKEARAMSGHPILVQSAVNAMKKWRYFPTIKNGISVDIVTNIDVKFELNP